MSDRPSITPVLVDAVDDTSPLLRTPSSDRPPLCKNDNMSITRAVQLAFKRLAPLEQAESWDNGESRLCSELSLSYTYAPRSALSRPLGWEKPPLSSSDDGLFD